MGYASKAAWRMAGERNSMKNLSRIVFWQNIVSLLQVPFIRELAKEFSGDVILAVPRKLTDERVKLGWAVPDCSPAKLIVNPAQKQIEELIQDRQKETCHVFSGMRGYPFVWSAFRASLNVKTTRAIISEPYHWQGLKGGLRLLRGRLDALCYGKYINCIFAVGSLAVRWFKMCGFADSKIVKFAYFTDCPKSGYCSKSTDGAYKIVFVGQCIKRKGIDLLVQALSGLKDKDWHLEVIGEGKDRANFQELTRKLGMGKKIDYLGAMRNSEVMLRLQSADLLVLPSRWDGWGAVVNEALMQGVPVVCTNHCGAADLLGASERGSVVESGSLESLRSAMESWIRKGPVKPEQRARIREWSQCIHGSAAADYLLRIIGHSEAGEGKTYPKAPWLS